MISGPCPASWASHSGASPGSLEPVNGLRKRSHRSVVKTLAVRAPSDSPCLEAVNGDDLSRKTGGSLYTSHGTLQLDPSWRGEPMAP